ncbi:hypothetical protein O0I10_006278 [Lichtheimia ornata]|uniref:Uncharacterized protein n=1 Tax=Lichtheimia ornata TaxID=688661 RepID=A0AAD7V4I9_9FUNG|nr:uncharacterized protein O0I10_006278 [Lichtheimia ornata]KAJ8658007.1 hypothetical protein O0I10_006278 [Lichtheimia ornata]
MAALSLGNNEETTSICILDWVMAATSAFQFASWQTHQSVVWHIGGKACLRIPCFQMDGILELWLYIGPLHPRHSTRTRALQLQTYMDRMALHQHLHLKSGFSLQCHGDPKLGGGPVYGPFQIICGLMHAYGQHYENTNHIVHMVDAATKVNNSKIGYEKHAIIKCPYHATTVLVIDSGFPMHNNCTIPHLKSNQQKALFSLLRAYTLINYSISATSNTNHKHQNIIEQTSRDKKVHGIKTNLGDMYRFVIQGHRAPCGHRLRVAWPLGAVLNRFDNPDITQVGIQPHQIRKSLKKKYVHGYQHYQWIPKSHQWLVEINIQEKQENVGLARTVLGRLGSRWCRCWTRIALGYHKQKNTENHI